MSTNASSVDLWAGHASMWRRPAQVIGAWWDAADPDPRLLQYTVRGPWWDLLETAGITLLVTREYEHLVVALNGINGRGQLSYLTLPHPSGIAVDRDRGRVVLASTRNPNQLIELQILRTSLPRGDVRGTGRTERVLMPRRTWFYPGCLYLHDLAFIGGRLHGNAVGQNAVVRFGDDGTYERVWWPKGLDAFGPAKFERNYLQVNSIAAGADVAGSCFSASAEMPSARRPGHRHFPVDGRGVIFDGKTREPICRGLTRPHSARLHRSRVWVDNSGYGGLGFVRDGKLETAARLPGWTRGLCFHRHIAFVGTSRVIPRYRQYAPGLDVEKSVCGLHAVDTRTGKVLASIRWPWGNQIFGIEWLPAAKVTGLPFRRAWIRHAKRHTRLFYTYDAGHLQEE